MQEIVNHNTVSMFWQIIQYTVITAGEIMFSITGLEFSYSQVIYYVLYCVRKVSQVMIPCHVLLTLQELSISKISSFVLYLNL